MKKDISNFVIYCVAFFVFVTIISFIYWAFAIRIAIKTSETGISEEHIGMHIESLCNHQHEMYYGSDAFWESIENARFYYSIFFFIIPIYQVFFINFSIYRSIFIYMKKKIYEKHENVEKNELFYLILIALLELFITLLLFIMILDTKLGFIILTILSIITLIITSIVNGKNYINDEIFEDDQMDNSTVIQDEKSR